ncbi:unnamed protein product [Absidia cylindrospora]
MIDKRVVCNDTLLTYDDDANFSDDNTSTKPIVLHLQLEHITRIVYKRGARNITPPLNFIQFMKLLVVKVASLAVRINTNINRSSFIFVP